MTKLDQLKTANNLSEFSEIIGYKPKNLSYIIYKIPDNKKYYTFSIEKKNGTERMINAPCERLKEVQQRTAQLLNICYTEIYAVKKYRNSLSHGFRPHETINIGEKDEEKVAFGIKSNAKKHKNKRFVFNIDLENFFPSINFGRVRGYFMASNDFKLNPKVATLIAQIACHNNELPQGSPCSPIISNFIGHILDVRLSRVAKTAKCTYSRYADDLTFSTREKCFPELIAVKDENNSWTPSKVITDKINTTGFKINNKKTSMQLNAYRQSVTGLTTNKKVNVKKEYYKQARSMCHNIFTSGKFYIGKEMKSGSLKTPAPTALGTKDQLRGVLSFIYDIKSDHDERDIKEKWKNPTAIHNLYRNFLYFDKFHSLERPLILCEGKTDNIYLKCALKALHKKYPSLIEKKDIFELKIDFFNYSKMNMDIMQFSGGTGDLAALIHHYNDRTKIFKCSGKKFPVIILVDNDSGAKPVFEKAKNIIKSSIDGKDEFYHITQNLYLISIPRPSPKIEMMIENLFESKILKTKIGGKELELDEKKFNKTNHYGKNIFAEKLIMQKRKEINFEQFSIILDRICAATLHHKSI
ncbi:retron Ec67 family RNA-directed DNA polymerase/endonuclease [uncultured Thalassospira sp.]|uniref:retron Ec67 family RNA-directed DNA polymerase/endonuclease n=1 Tax=uncultured Thalassospira sp. TaxID=404382 RepID=UPI0030D9D2C5|tara:strand:- start:287 stop:2032 length:1746 start_codon:yes stop_codon:yes gene_type:complete